MQKATTDMLDGAKIIVRLKNVSGSFTIENDRVTTNDEEIKGRVMIRLCEVGYQPCIAIRQGDNKPKFFEPPHKVVNIEFG